MPGSERARSWNKANTADRVLTLSLHRQGCLGHSAGDGRAVRDRRVARHSLSRAVGYWDGDGILSSLRATWQGLIALQVATRTGKRWRLQPASPVPTPALGSRLSPRRARPRSARQRRHEDLDRKRLVTERNAPTQ